MSIQVDLDAIKIDLTKYYLITVQRFQSSIQHEGIVQAHNVTSIYNEVTTLTPAEWLIGKIEKFSEYGDNYSILFCVEITGEEYNKLRSAI